MRLHLNKGITFSDTGYILIFIHYRIKKSWFNYLISNSLLFTLEANEFININFKEFCNLDKCLHRWLRNIGAPFAYSGRRTPQPFGKPFIGSLFIYEYNFYPIFHLYSFEVILLRSACTLFISRYPSV